jgi:hypothetical protein
MSVDIEAYYRDENGNLASCVAYLHYSPSSYYRDINNHILNVSYNARGVAHDIPSLLGLPKFSEPEGITEVDWGEALDRALDLLVHRDMIEGEGLLYEIVLVVHFIMTAYKSSLIADVVVRWSR